MTSVLTKTVLSNIFEEYFSDKAHYDAITNNRPFWVEYVDYDGETTADSWDAELLEEEFARGTLFTFVGLVVNPDALTDAAYFYIGD